MNNKTCTSPGCTNNQTVFCRVVYHWGDFPAGWFLNTYGLVSGLRFVWRLWWTGTAEDFENICIPHCKESGYCFSCGEYWAGCPEFEEHPEGLCPCCDEFVDVLGDGLIMEIRGGREDAELDLDLDVWAEYVEGLDFSGLDDDG